MILWLSLLAHAGLGPEDVVVLYNADDPEALETAEQYATARDLTDAQLCPIAGVDPTTTQVTFEEFNTLIREPFEACRDALPHPEDIDVIVLVRGLPYVVSLPSYVASLSATLQVGRAVNSSGAEIAGLAQVSGPNQASIINPLWGGGSNHASEMTASYGYNFYYSKSPELAHGEVTPGPFIRSEVRESSGITWPNNLYIVTRLDGFDHADARALIDRGVQADSSFPDAPFTCMRGADAARGARDAECEHATRMLDAAGFATEWIPAFDNALSRPNVISYWTGAANMRDAIDGVTYAPGAIADNLTSFGARPNNFFCDEDGTTCPASESQTSIARFVRAGATGVQGTVAEPLNNVFPNAGTLILYSQGFSLGEAWLPNQRHLHWVNTYLGDPLTAPFADRPVVTLPATAPTDQALGIEAEHSNGIRELAIYVDGERVYRSTPTGEEGSLFPEDWANVSLGTVNIYAVAIADDAPPLDVDGWPAGPVQFFPRTKGWARTTLDVQAPEEPVEEGGCGCKTGPTSALWFGPLLMLAVGRRRR